LAGLASTARLAAADAPKAPVKRPPNPYVYKFNIGKIEAFSISDGHMLFRQGLDLMWPEADRPAMKEALIFNRERLDALPLYVNIMGLKIGDEVALIDAGFGERHPNPNFGWLAEGLRQLGIRARAGDDRFPEPFAFGSPRRFRRQRPARLPERQDLPAAGGV
jgi:hypothetical protein